MHFANHSGFAFGKRRLQSTIVHSAGTGRVFAAR
jgi:hypothetical protein